MNLEEKVILYKSLGIEIADLELKRKALGQDILSEMTAMKMEVAGYRLSKYTRFFFKTSVEQARLLNATKMEETLDKDKLKEIYKSGVEVKGMTEATYVHIAQTAISNFPEP